MSWTSGASNKVIRTPRGEYTCVTDDIETEAIAAARFAGLRDFNFRINGKYYESPALLPTKSISALCQSMTIENVDVSPFDTAGITLWTT
jgi:hypothetical protein